MYPVFRRLYSTLPDAAASARTASTPRAVRLRRLRKRPAISPLESDANEEGLSPSEFAQYQRSLAKGELMKEDGGDLTEAEWLEKLNARRNRIRGARELRDKDGEKQTQVVGQKIFLPNIIFKLVRNHTPPGQPYNPYEATFRVPQSVTKTDVRSYLEAVYGVKTTYIRTDNYNSPLHPCVVGLVDPFYYPLAVEDMNATERAEHKEWLQRNLLVGSYEERRKLHFLRMTRSAQGKGWKWRTGSTAQRGNILQLIAERRAEREDAILDAQESIREGRKTLTESSA
ncbi:54S ribosomal protein L23, mitochondrial [Grifola frondosa]|uniref:Large ribosomal subunit protein uL23m n=1 Tax=Grifola frondosa TaxID=5627 RepID=A0A1C7LQ03_GRIFR|nr:54S ribosomal protein L23, mitochondrial [Grifola frondosa]